MRIGALALVMLVFAGPAGLPHGALPTVSVFVGTAKGGPDDLTRLRVEPDELSIDAPHRVLVSGQRRDGLWVDLSRTVRIEAADAEVVRVEGAMIVPLRAGSTTVRASAGGLSASARVTVREGRAKVGPDFRLDVLPVLTRLGCNAGACHGAAKGQNNFKLSLLGYDADADHEALALALRSRRVNRARPEASLMLLKPTNKVSHGGGRVMGADSDEHRVVLDWIRAGTPRRTRDETLTGIDVHPVGRVLPPGSEQQLVVVARYSDGCARDVTARTLFSSNDDAVAGVTPQGLARVRAGGETPIVVRYGGHVKAVLLGAPLGDAAEAPLAAANAVDEILARKWASLRIRPSPRASDEVLLRRLHLDAIGTLPTPEEVRAFLADRSADKLTRKVDELLRRPEFDAFWTLRFSEWLLVGASKFPPAYPQWIRAHIERDAPLTELARSLVTARGGGPESSFFRVSNDPRLTMEFTIQTFHGFRMQCANCHNHPLERFSQDEYHALAGFYARTRIGREGVVDAPLGELTHPRTGKPVAPALPGGGPVEGDRRAALAAWLTSDRRFARAFANRLWAEAFGRGLVHPVDDIRASNPAVVPELLEALTDEFAKNPGLRPFLRLLFTSNAYALDSRGPADERFFAKAVAKPLGAEVLLDAIAQATGVPNAFGRAIEQYDPTAQQHYTLQAFGRCARDTACTLKGEFTGSLKQALHLISDDVVNDRVRNVRQWLGRTDAELVGELHLRSLSRPPSEAERTQWVRALGRGPRQEIAEDLFWALIMSREFQFRH